MHILIHAFIISIVGLTLAADVMAQSKRDVRSEARALAKSLRAVGEPADRCSLGAELVEGGTVIHASEASGLRRGDRLQSVSGLDVSDSPAEAVPSTLQKIPPGAVIPVTVQRQGRLRTLSITCGNTRPYYSTVLKGLDEAARAKFDRCYATFSSRQDLGALGMQMRLRCARLSKNAEQYDIAALLYEWVREGVETAALASSERAQAVQRLRGAQPMITEAFGPSRMEELIALTRLWPGGENAWEATEQ
jgi:hypothetical protein